ncbi:MAG: DUF4339 domain-containing protein [Archangiaceae bacterium]|nr:DUF4339 domain-containing protein [Archangiaceae bacterium]
MPTIDDPQSPLSDASDSDINRLVDDVLRSGKHLTTPESPEQRTERYHARAIAEQMQRLAQQISQGGVDTTGRDDVDEWWFEVQGKRIGPLSLKKIRLLWEDGELTPDSLCWHQGFPRWVSLFKVSELAEALTPKLHVDVDQAVSAFAKASSGEWASPGATAMENANKKKLERTQAREPDPLPLSTPVNLSDEHAATYAALRIDRREPEDEVEAAPPRRSAAGQTLLSGLIAGVIAAVAIVGARVFWPTPVVQPIVINLGQAAPAAAPAPAPTPAAAAAAAPVPSPPPAPVPAPAPAPAVAKPPEKPAPAPAVAAAPPEEKKPATVEDAFAKAFAEVPPDELTTGEVFEVVRNHKAQVDACVEQQHAAAPDATGKLVMRWSVEPDGTVSEVAANAGEMSKSALADCLAKEIAGWSFPKHALAHPPVEFPFKY